MKNGFTLVELLAVIIVLAAITLIVVPVVIKVINDAEDGIDLISGEKYIDAVNQTVFEKNLDKKFSPNECTINTDGNLTCDEVIIEINSSDVKPDGGKIRFHSREVETAFLRYGDKTLGMKHKGELVLLEPVSFAEDSWDTIEANVIVGNLSKYKVGDTKEIALTGFTNGETGSNGLYTVRIANTTTPTECSTSGFSQTACGFVIEFEDIILANGDNAKMNLTLTNAGGWKDSKMRTYVNDTIYNALPKELRELIIDTTVVSSHGSTSGETNFVSEDKVYLLSTKEVWEQGTSNQINYDTARDVTRQLDYYKNYENEDGSIGVTTNNYSGAIKKYNGSADLWWLRSATSDLNDYFCHVNYYGDWNDGGATNTYGVAVAFRIG